MALDRQSLDFLNKNTLVDFSSFDIIGEGASVLADTATIPPGSYVGYNLNNGYNLALASAAYRKFQLLVENLPLVSSDYNATQQLLIELNALYAINTQDEIIKGTVKFAVNKDSCTPSGEKFLFTRIFPTLNKEMQSATLKIFNNGLNTVTIQAAKLFRSADVNRGQLANIIDESDNAMTPMQFKVYDPEDDNRVEGIGVIVRKNVEVKFKGIVQDNKTVQFETNFCDPIEVVYVKEHINLNTQ